MSQAQRIKIPRLPDRSIIDCFTNLAKQHGITTLQVSALGFSQLGAVELTGDPIEEFEALLSHNSTLLNTCSFNISGLNIAFYRGGQYPPEQQSPIWDEILLTWNQQQGKLSNQDKMAIVAQINLDLKAFEPGRFVDSGLSEEQTQLLSIHEGTLERLERLNEDLIRQNSEFREQLEKRYEEKNTALEEKAKEKEEKLEQNYEIKADTLKEKEQKISEKLAAIDDRNNTHVRREIRDRMLDDVKNRISNFGVSESTENKRKPVMLGMFLLIFLSTILLIFTGYEINKAESNTYASTQILKENTNSEKIVKSEILENVTTDRVRIYWLWARLALLSFALLGTILYYIRWQNNWAEQHSASEFQLQQFYIDVNRANWAIESCLEWKKETDSEIPPDLLGSITRNLFFAEHREPLQLTHPADELASALMGSASNLKLNLNGNELEFNKPGKIPKKVNKTA